MCRLVWDDRKVSVAPPIVATKVYEIPSLNKQDKQPLTRWTSAAENNTVREKCCLIPQVLNSDVLFGRQSQNLAETSSQHGKHSLMLMVQPDGGALIFMIQYWHTLAQCYQLGWPLLLQIVISFSLWKMCTHLLMSLKWWWSGTRNLNHTWLADKSAATVWCHHIKMDQNPWGIFPTPFWKSDTLNEGNPITIQGRSSF